MTNEVGTAGGRRAIPWRTIGWGRAVALILLPLVAMQFTSGVGWSVGDFIAASLLLGLVGLSLELTAFRSGSSAYRVATGLAVLACLLLICVNGAAGMIGDEDNPYNLLFVGLVPLALVGAVLARFRARGMAIVAFAAGIGQLAFALFGLQLDPRGGMFSALLAGPWFLSAALFRKAAAESSDPR